MDSFEDRAPEQPGDEDRTLESGLGEQLGEQMGDGVGEQSGQQIFYSILGPSSSSDNALGTAHYMRVS